MSDASPAFKQLQLLPVKDLTRRLSEIDYRYARFVPASDAHEAPNLQIFNTHGMPTNHANATMIQLGLGEAESLRDFLCEHLGQPETT